MTKFNVYWMTNPEWYGYDYTCDEWGMPYLTERATDEAVESFKDYLMQKKRKYSKDEFAKFAEYVIYYPDEDDPDFDGEHYGGIKGLSDDAPEEAKYAFKKYMYEYYEAQRFNRKI